MFPLKQKKKRKKNRKKIGIGEKEMSKFYVQTTTTMMIPRRSAMAAATLHHLLLLLLCAPRPSHCSATTDYDDDDDASSSWQKFGTNVNYRITAMLDVNGGAPRIPPFDSGSRSTPLPPSSSSSAGYSVPIDVLTVIDPATNVARQRVSYFSGTQVEYNTDGKGYRSVPSPYDYHYHHVDGDGDGDEDVDMDALIEGGHKKKSGSRRLCYNVGDDGGKHPYLNFFPTVEQMKHYELGRLVTDTVRDVMTHEIMTC